MSGASHGAVAAPPLADATVWRRFMGMVYESILLVGPVLVYGFVYAVLTGQTDDSPEEASAKRLGLQLSVYALCLFYFAWGWSRGRVTLPMQTLALRVVDAQTGGGLSRSQALLRAAVGSLSLVTGLWLIFGLLRSDRQSFHDWIAGTRLVHTPRS
ncbi:MAG: RDD family protein [Betaproteobacteria bacterium]|nr:RDD family protein [Betaproteobacteria bacterium]